MSRRSRWVWHELHLPRPLEADLVIACIHRILTSHHLGPVIFETRYQPDHSHSNHRTGDTTKQRQVTLTRSDHAGNDFHIPNAQPATKAGSGQARRRRLQFLIGARPTTVTTVLRLLAEQLSGITTTHTPSRTRVPVTTAGRVTMRRPTLALDASRLQAVTRASLAAFAQTRTYPSAYLVVQIMIGPRHAPAATTGAGIGDPAQSWLSKLAHGIKPAPAVITSSHARALAQHTATVSVRIGASGTTPVTRHVNAHNLFGAYRVLETAGARLHLTPEPPNRLNQATRPWHPPLQLNAADITALLAWPLGTDELPGVGPIHPRVLPPPHHTTKGAEVERVFADTNAPGPSYPVGITMRDACHHTVLLGPTGAGKSTAMLHLITADINAGRPVIVIDPKTDLTRDVLARIPAHRHCDVVILDPLSDRPVGFNPLAPQPGQRPDVAADTVLSTFKSVFADSWGVRTQDVLTASLLTLARTPGASLVWLPHLLTNPTFRARVLATSPPDVFGTSSFWAHYEAMTPQLQAQTIGPVLTKLRYLLLRPHLRAVLGQATPRTSLAEVFSRNRILLVSLNKGLLGPDTATLLGTLLLSQLWPLILARADTPAPRRTPASVFVDEAHDFLGGTTDLADALAQSRSLGVAWHLAHQYRAQIPPAMRAAIDTNARNKIMFGMSADDARDTARHTTTLEPQDFQLLPRFGIYTQTIHHGHPQPWTSATTRPAPPATTDVVALTTTSANTFGHPAPDTDHALADLLDLAPTPQHPAYDQARPAAQSDRPQPHANSAAPQQFSRSPATTSTEPAEEATAPGRSASETTAATHAPKAPNLPGPQAPSDQIGRRRKQP